MSESASRFSDLVDGVINGIVEALTNRPSMTQARRDAQAWVVREMLLGLGPVDVRQLMVASQAVLIHALTIEAAGGEPMGDAGGAKLRTLSAAGNLSRTITRHLDTLNRCQAPASRTVAPLPADDHGSEAVTFFQRAVAETMSGATAKPAADGGAAPPLNRQQKRHAEREYARLARRVSAIRTMPAAQARDEYKGSVAGE